MMKHTKEELIKQELINKHVPSEICTTDLSKEAKGATLAHTYTHSFLHTHTHVHTRTHAHHIGQHEA